MLARVAPGDALKLIQDQVIKIAQDKNGGLLTIGMLGTIWSTSSGVNAIIDTLNQAYDIQEGRPWWKVKMIALGLTVALAVFIVSGVRPRARRPDARGEGRRLDAPRTGVRVDMEDRAVAGRVRARRAGDRVDLLLRPGRRAGVDLDHARVDRRDAAMGADLARHSSSTSRTSASYNATYGTIGGIIILMLWIYVSSLAVLVGAEMNAEIEHASPYGKEPGEKESARRRSSAWPPSARGANKRPQARSNRRSPARTATWTSTSRLSRRPLLRRRAPATGSQRRRPRRGRPAGLHEAEVPLEERLRLT